MKSRSTKPQHPRDTSVNIYDGMVTRNVVDTTYDVNELGWSISTHPAARTISSGMLRSATPSFSGRQPKVALDRTMLPDDPQKGFFATSRGN